MTKLNFSLGVLLVGAAVAAGNFMACSSKNNTPPSTGAAGTTGAAGAAGTGAAGSGAAGMASATLPDGGCVENAFKHAGVCACQDGTPDVCGTACTDVKLDFDNCGMCGHKCSATTTCNAGTCGAEPAATLAAVTGCKALTLAVAGGSLYYADEGHGTINKVGGTAAIVTGEMSPTWLTAAGTELYWYNKDTKTVRHVAAAGGTPNNVYVNNMPMGDAAAPPTVGGIGASADGMTAYVGVGTQVLTVPAAGGTATQVVNEDKGGLVGGISVLGTTILYPTGLNGDVDAPTVTTGMIEHCGVEDDQGNVMMSGVGHLCPRLARSQGSLFLTWAYANGTRGYWVDGSTVKTEILLGPDAMGTNEEVAHAVQQPIVAIAANPTNVYFAEYGTDPSTNMPVSFIEKRALTVNMANDPSVLIARGQGNVTSMALDASKVYWAKSDCSIASAAQ
jgi:hypothetical protein